MSSTALRRLFSLLFIHQRTCGKLYERFCPNELTAWRESFLPRLHRNIGPHPPVLDQQGQTAHDKNKRRCRPVTQRKKHGVPSEKYTNRHVRWRVFRIPGPLHDKDHTYKVPKDSAWVKQLRWKEAVSNLLGSLDWVTHQDAVKSTTTSLSPASARTASKSALFSMERTMVHAIQTERNNASNGTAAKKIKELTALVSYALFSLAL